MVRKCYTSPSSFKLKHFYISLYSKWACARWNNCVHVRNFRYLPIIRTINIYNTKTSSRRLFPGRIFGYNRLVMILWVIFRLLSSYLRGSYFPVNIGLPSSCCSAKLKYLNKIMSYPSPSTNQFICEVCYMYENQRY